MKVFYMYIIVKNLLQRDVFRAGVSEMMQKGLAAKSRETNFLIILDFLA